MNNKQLSEILKGIADESRVTIIRLLLRNKKMNGCDFLPYLDCKQATLSHHMSVLEELEIVKAKKKGNKVFYSINYNTLETVLSIFNVNKSIDIEDKVDVKVSENKKEVKESPAFDDSIFVPTMSDPDIVRDFEEKIKTMEDEEENDVPVFLL